MASGTGMADRSTKTNRLTAQYWSGY